jgi:Cu/Zn superoxide dismutase
MLRTRLVCVLGAIAFVISCESSTDVQGSTSYGATLNGANEKPTATTSTATGVFTASLHPTNGTLSYSLSWTGLTGAVTGAHIHGPGDANAVANVIIDFSAPPAGTVNNTMTTTATGAASGNLNLNTLTVGAVTGDSLRILLNAGLLYVNVHTAANAGGEIRGQITKK